MSDTTSVLVAGARTPMGRLLGSLSSFSASDLGGIAIKGALEKAGITGDQVDYVIMGQVLTAGAGQIPARQAAVKGGIPMDVPALTVNKVCLSGINAIALADQIIRAGEADVVVAVPDSGNPAAAGYSLASGIPRDDGLIKNRYVARTFIQPGQELRRHGLRMKFNPLPEVVGGRRVVVVSAARPVPGSGRVRRRTVVRVSTVGGVSGRPSQVRGMRAGRRPGQQNQRGDGGDPAHGGALTR